MGASLPEDGPNTLDGNKVDDHLRALFALEGRSSNSSSPLTPSFGITKVDLPDFGAELEKKPDLTALPSKPSFNANNSLTGKRDSFGKLLTPAFNAKKELQTLLEEDEGDDFASDPGCSVMPAAPRHRPRSLNLRSSLIRLSASLPTPSPTPSVRTPKLKSLTLASSTVVTSSPPRNDNGQKRSSTLVTSHSSPLLSAAEVGHIHRQSSISYRRASNSETALTLPSSDTNRQTLTPSPSPTFEKHRRSLSPTERLAQSAYFAQSHASFLARIAELEAALARSTATPSPAPTEPSEELLEMLADLKAERDLLKRSLDDLIARYNDQEKQLNALSRRLDNEKRDGWVHREKLRRAEAEKQTVEQEKEDLNEELASLRLQLQTARSQAHAEKEARLKTERELYAALDSQKAAAAPYPYPTAYRRIQESIDSELNHEGHHANFEAQVCLIIYSVLFLSLLYFAACPS
jgi:predicted  nucleic acid-binding Zn-ribbon protein